MVVTSKRREPRVGVLDARSARLSALDALARRDRTADDLRRKLVAKGYDPAVVAELIERLTAEKLVDDRRYVENFIGFRASRGQGPVRVRTDLQKLGISGDWVEQSLAAYADWDAQLEKARQKKFGAALPTDYAGRQRQARYLGYRGFTGVQIRLALGFDIEIDADT